MGLIYSICPDNRPKYSDSTLKSLEEQKNLFSCPEKNDQYENLETNYLETNTTNNDQLEVNLELFLEDEDIIQETNRENYIDLGVLNFTIFDLCKSYVEYAYEN